MASRVQYAHLLEKIVGFSLEATRCVKIGRTEVWEENVPRTRGRAWHHGI